MWLTKAVREWLSFHFRIPGIFPCWLQTDLCGVVTLLNCSWIFPNGKCGVDYCSLLHVRQTKRNCYAASFFRVPEWLFYFVGLGLINRAPISIRLSWIQGAVHLWRKKGSQDWVKACGLENQIQFPHKVFDPVYFFPLSAVSVLLQLQSSPDFFWVGRVICDRENISKTLGPN